MEEQISTPILLCNFIRERTKQRASKDQKKAEGEKAERREKVELQNRK